MDTKAELSELAKKYKAGFCLMPKNFNALPKLAVARRFMVPSWVDHRQYTTPTEDQGAKPWCAAYSAAQWAESILWQRDGSWDHIDPTWIYKYAKSVDGDPNGDGTTLTAVLEALVEVGGNMFSPKVCRVETIKPTRLALKYALHKFGCVLTGWNISSEWYGCNKSDAVITGQTGTAGLGGHAVVAYGYDKEGVWIQNSWGASWGEYGLAKILWSAFDKQFMYGSVLSNCLDGLSVAS